jgi:hypothetical protein
VEVFSVEDFSMARQTGVRYPMLSLRSALADSGEEQIISLMQSRPIKFVAVAYKIMRRYESLLRKMRRNGVCAYVFTLNDSELMKAAFDGPVYGAYTDGWNVNKGDCNVDECDSY